MPTIFALLKLKPDVSVEDYERWVVESDVPVALAIPSITEYGVYKMSAGLDGSEAEYQYIEKIEVSDVDKFREDLGAEGPQKLGAEFAELAEGSFLLGDKLAP